MQIKTQKIKDVEFIFYYFSVFLFFYNYKFTAV